MSDLNNEVKLSVIIPMYNSEKYIEKCIKSIAQQSFRNIEIIVIDDGSSDNSAMLVKYMAERDERIRLYQQLNYGVSAARNEGVKRAEGNYITFVDADDYLQPDTYAHILSNMLEKNIQNAIYAYEYVDDRNNDSGIVELPWKEGSILDTSKIRGELIPLMIAGQDGRRQINGSVCRTIYANEIAKRNLFDEKIEIQEDLIYCLQTYMQIDKLLIINDVRYKYVKHGTTTTEHYRKGFYNESIKFEDKILDVLKQGNMISKVSRQYFAKRIGMYSLSVSNLFRFDAPKDISDELDEIIEGFYKDPYVIINKNMNILSKKMQVFYLLLRLKAKNMIRLIYKAKEKNDKVN